HLEALFAEGEAHQPLPPDQQAQQNRDGARAFPPAPAGETDEERDTADGAVAPSAHVNHHREPTLLPVALPEALRAELAATNTTPYDWITREGRQQREVRGQYQRTADLRISTTDPDATPMRLKGGGTHLATRPTTSSMGADAASSWGCW